MKEQIMVLKVKENKNSRFYEKSSARLFNRKEMEKFAELVSSCVMCGCEIKVELEEMEKEEWKWLKLKNITHYGAQKKG